MRKIALFAFLSLAFASDKFIKTKINDDITVSLPSSMVKMTDDDIVVRSTMVRAPLAAYTNADRDVDFTANISATQWPDANLDVASKFFKANLYNLYDKIDMINSGTYEVNKKKFLYYEFESRVNGNKLKEAERLPIYRYIYVQYNIEKSRTLVFTFSCPRDKREDWQPVAHKIMKSVKLK